MGAVFGRISFFVNAGLRFIEEHAKLRAMGILWEELGRERYGVRDPRLLRFRYGVQVNSLGLTEVQPENNLQRIALEALAVTLGRYARARAIQLPAWNEALGLPRPWDQQWSLRIQQVLAYETDILEYPDIFEGSKVMDGLVAELLEGARAEMAVVAEHGGAVEAVPYMKAALVESNRERVGRIESGEQIVVGQNRFTETEDSPLTQDADGGILVVDPAVEASRSRRCDGGVSEREEARRRRALAELARVAADERSSENLMVAHDRGRARRCRRPASGPRRCARSSAPTAPHRVAEAAAHGSARTRRPGTELELDELREPGRPGSARSSAAGRRCSSASQGSTGIPTGPSRSP